MVFRLFQKQGGISVGVVAVVKSEVLILGEFLSKDCSSRYASQKLELSCEGTFCRLN